VWSRVTEIRNNDRAGICGDPNPSMRATYRQNMNAGVPNWSIQTDTLLRLVGDPYAVGSGDTTRYATQVAYLDGFGRTLETHTQSPVPGKVMVTRSEYGSTGQIRRSSEPFTIERLAPALQQPRAALPANQIPRDTRTTYDALGRVALVEQIHSAAVTSEQTTEYSGWTTTVHPATKPGEPTLYASTRSTVDAFGQTTAVTRLAKGSTPSSTTTFEYDKLGRKTATVNPQTGRTELLYNTAGWVRRIDDEHTGATTFSYYPNGSVAESENARNHTIEYTLDWRGRTTQVARANGELIATYAYDQLANDTVQFGVTTHARSYSNGVSDPDLPSFEAKTLAVDSMGRVTRTSSRVFPSGLTATPPVGDVEWNTVTAAHEFTTRFTRTGTAWSATLPAIAGADGASSAETVTTEFGPTGVPLSTNTNLNSDSYSVVQHDEIGRLVSEVLGGSGTGIGLRREFEFQPSTGRLSRATSTIVAPTGNALLDRQIQQDNYVYDVVGNIVRLGHDPDAPGAQLAAEDEVECFYYDPASRLVGGYGSQRVNGDLPSCVAGPSDIPGINVEGVTYRERTAFNPSGTISAHRAADYNYAASAASPAPSGCNSAVTPSLPSAAKAVGGDVAESYRYDCSGNLIQTRDSAGTVLFDYSWDNSGRLAQVIDRRSGAARTSRFRYDTAGQRVAKVDPDGVVTVYLGGTEVRYDPANPAGGRLSVARSYGSVVRGHDGRVSFAASNHQGSNTAALVVGGGTAPSIEVTRYRPYGELREGDGVNDRAFLNQVHDADIGLHYLNARYYNPAIGQFISVDPLVATTGEAYVYGSGSPITLSDPSGLCSVGGFGSNDASYAEALSYCVAVRSYTDRSSETWGTPSGFLNSDHEFLSMTNLVTARERLRGRNEVNEMKAVDGLSIISQSGLYSDEELEQRLEENALERATNELRDRYPERFPKDEESGFSKKMKGLVMGLWNASNAYENDTRRCCGVLDERAVKAVSAAAETPYFNEGLECLLGATTSVWMSAGAIYAPMASADGVAQRLLLSGAGRLTSTVEIPLPSAMSCVN
jgi:RHS repeat-associated protein